MKSLKLASILFSLVVLVAVGCSKKGDAGPAGPAGTAGAPGPAGPDSVIYSAWITLSTTQQVDAQNDTFYTQTISAPSLTQDIITKGVIVSYINIPDAQGNDGIFPTASVSQAISETFAVGSIDIVSVVDLTGFAYRYVIIAGTIQANRIVSGPAKGLTKDQIQNMSYNDLQKLVGSGTQGRAGSN